MLLEGSSVHARDGIITLDLPFFIDNEDGLRDLLKDGAVLELGIKAAIERERSWWANSKAVEAEFRSTIRHDPLNRDFLVVYPTLEGEKELRDKNLTRLLHGSWHSLSLPIASVADIPAEEQAEELLLAVSVSLQHTEVPPWLKNSSIFWSSEIVPSEKVTLRFFLPAAAAGP